MKTLAPIWQVDAFTNTPFRGNPAGVCLLDAPLSDEQMQAIAAEMNLSETAFVSAQGKEFKIRYFTPLIEVSLCGHATLSSAHILWEQERVPLDAQISLLAKGGHLYAQRQGDWICLDFPTRPVEPTPITESELVDKLTASLGAAPVTVFKKLRRGYLVELDSESTVKELTPDFGLMVQQKIRSVIVTARSQDTAFDFVSRFFAPEIGINEDPATGVAHCTLGPFWAERLGKSKVTGHQVSRRGGIVRVSVRSERVTLQGQAVTVIEGRIRVNG